MTPDLSLLPEGTTYKYSPRIWNYYLPNGKEWNGPVHSWISHNLTHTAPAIKDCDSNKEQEKFMKRFKEVYEIKPTYSKPSFIDRLLGDRPTLIRYSV